MRAYTKKMLGETLTARLRNHSNHGSSVTLTASVV
jgi:hypothetical protein